MRPKNEAQAKHRRLIVLAVVLAIGALAIVGRLFYYQVRMHAQLVEMALAERERERELLPQRGNIMDSTGHPLAMSVIQWDISVSPRLVDNPEELAEQLADLLDMPKGELYARLTSDVDWTPLVRGCTQEMGEAVASLKAGGIICEPRARRVYPEGTLAAHMVGIVSDGGVGFYGVEGYYNRWLTGIEGKKEIEQTGVGEEIPLPSQAEMAATAGTNLILTVDRNIQMIAAQELEWAVKEYQAESGTVVIMDPRTGAILAIANYPSYDPNLFPDVDGELLADASLSRMWEPGSIFKVITWAAGLDSGTISPGTTVYDSGSREVGGRVIWNWDRMGRGWVTMTDGLALSLNTVAAFISTSVGKETFYTYVQRFGFGNLTKVDLASEGPGMVKRPGDSNWFPSDLGTNAFGQGIAVTPVQMLSAVSAVANHGLLMKPYIVGQFITTEKAVSVEPMAMRQTISEQTAETLTEMLVEVVSREATKAQVAGYRIAGKTGTAQVPTAYGYDPTATIASFVGFAPADDPQFAVLIKLDKPQASPWANHTAAPTFRAIAERLLVYLQIPPDEIRLASGG
ncbi:MAG: penicillin-binding protein 2 [Anaerolineae bacterium]|nr:penicillin-binding protein 2 [Anaerolineae bacterium]